eukprot:4948705-Lingulodinium_polyedra.AAC.1
MKLDSASQQGKEGVPEKQTTKTGKSEVNKLRQQCKNTLHTATVILSDVGLDRKARIIYTLTAGIRKWHSDQNSTS